MIWANPWRAVAGAVTLVCVALLIRIHGLPLIGGGLIADLDRMTELRTAEASNHRTTKATYRAAQADAAKREAERSARVHAEQERINTDAQDNLSRRLSDLRQRYDSLRTQAGKAAGSAGDGQPVPSLPAATGRTDAAPGTDGLSLSERYEASAIAIQLDELISWVERQASIDPNKGN